MVQPNYKLAKAQQEFKQFYDKNLRHKYAELEPARQKFIGQFWRRSILCGIVCFAVYWMCHKDMISEATYSSDGFIKLCLAAIVGMLWWCSLPFSEYREETKSLVMDKILSFWGNFFYSRVSAVDEADIKESELFCDYNLEETDDSFQGTYENTVIRVAEKNLRVKGNKHDYSVFKGVMILLEFNKRFQAKTVVKNKGNFNGFMNENVQILTLLPVVIGLSGVLVALFMVARDNFERGLFVFMALTLFLLLCRKLFSQSKQANQTVYLEEIKFNKKWNVLTNDQIEARCILTPVFMEKINRVKKLFYGRHIDFSFYDNKLFIAVHTRKNLFETTSLFTPALSYVKVREVVGQLHSIFSVIDVLGLQKQTDVRNNEFPF